MPLDYDQSNALMNNLPFRGRIKVASLNYSNYIFGEASGTSFHNTKLKWAAETSNQPDQTAMKIQPMVTMDAAVQNEGIDPTDGDSTITDEALKIVVETVVNTRVL